MRLSLDLVWVCCLLPALIPGQEEEERSLVQPAEAQFTTSPKQEIVNEGMDIRLPCFVEHMADYVLVWKFGETVLSVGEKVVLREKVIEYKNRLRVEKGENGNWLVVSGAREEDSGNYICMVSAFILKTLEHRVMVRSRPRVEVEREREVVLEGSNISVVCNVKAGQPLPELTWLNSKGELLSSGPNLVINKVTRDRAGVYMCRGDNGFNSEGGLARLELVVEFSPILEEEETIHSSQGLPVTLNCPVEASPEAVVTWTREGQELSPPLHDMIPPEDGLYTMTVTPSLADTENSQDISFSCTATNTRGNATKTFLVTSRPSKPVFTSSPNSSSTDKISLEWTLVTGLALESCQLEVLGPKSFILNETILSDSPLIEGPETDTGKYTAKYSLGPDLMAGSQYQVRVLGTNSHGQGPGSEWFVVTTATVSASSSSSSSSFLLPVILVLMTYLVRLCNLL